MIVKRDDGSIHSSHAGYNKDIYGSPLRWKATVNVTLEALQEVLAHSFPPVDAIAFRGSSGAAMGYTLAYLSGVPPLYIRKPKEKSHGSVTEGPEGPVRRYVIVDDFSSSGETLKTILGACYPAQCAAILLYARNGNRELVELGEFQSVPIIHTTSDARILYFPDIPAQG